MTVAGQVSRRSVPLLVLEAMRPRQWIKNLFVFAGITFAGRWLDAGDVLSVLAVFVAFCLASSATYLLNDALDAERDRHNPRTAGRPIARGDLAVSTAIAASVLAAAVGVGLAAVVTWQAGLVVIGYLALQVAYSWQLKHVLFVDVMVIATGFVLRVVAGVVAIDVVVSPWILLCTGLLALFLALGKRRAEAVALGGAAQPQRRVLEHYSVGLLDELISVVTPTTVVAYALYTITGARTDWMLLTLPFVLYGIFRVLYLIHHQHGNTEEPDVVVWRDPPLLACVVLWGVAAAVVTLTAG